MDDLDELDSSLSLLGDARLVKSPTPEDQPEPPPAAAARSHTPPPNAAARLVGTSTKPQPSATAAARVIPKTATAAECAPAKADAEPKALPKPGESTNKVRKADVMASTSKFAGKVLTPSPSSSKVGPQCWIPLNAAKPKAQKMPKIQPTEGPKAKSIVPAKSIGPPRPPSTPPPTNLSSVAEAEPTSVPPWRAQPASSVRADAPQPPQPASSVQADSWRAYEKWHSDDNWPSSVQADSSWSSSGQADSGWHSHGKWSKDGSWWSSSAQSSNSAFARDEETKARIREAGGSTRIRGPSGGKCIQWQTALKKVQACKSPVQLRNFIQNYPKPQTREEDQEFAKQYYEWDA